MHIHGASQHAIREAARVWLACRPPELPPEVHAAFAGHTDFGRFTRWSAEPEAAVRFDSHGGQPRSCDLLVRAEDARGPLVICVEARADEPFGRTVAEERTAAALRLRTNLRSKGLERLGALRAILFGDAIADAQLDELRYQLLVAAAGALAAASEGERTVMLVHELAGPGTRPERLDQNGRDLDAFVHALSRGAIGACPAGEIVGPMDVPGSSAPVYVGKARRSSTASGVSQQEECG